MFISGSAKDAVKVEAVDKMRDCIKSQGTRKQKEIAVNAVFWQLMDVLDAMEGSKNGR